MSLSTISGSSAQRYSSSSLSKANLYPDQALKVFKITPLMEDFFKFLPYESLACCQRVCSTFWGVIDVILTKDCTKLSSAGFHFTPDRLSKIGFRISPELLDEAKDYAEYRNSAWQPSSEHEQFVASVTPQSKVVGLVSDRVFLDPAQVGSYRISTRPHENDGLEITRKLIFLEGKAPGVRLDSTIATTDTLAKRNANRSEIFTTIQTGVNLLVEMMEQLAHSGELSSDQNDEVGHQVSAAILRLTSLYHKQLDPDLSLQLDTLVEIFEMAGIMTMLEEQPNAKNPFISVIKNPAVKAALLGVLGKYTKFLDDHPLIESQGKGIDKLFKKGVFSQFAETFELLNKAVMNVFLGERLDSLIFALTQPAFSDGRLLSSVKATFGLLGGPHAHLLGSLTQIHKQTMEKVQSGFFAILDYKISSERGAILTNVDQKFQSEIQASLDSIQVQPAPIEEKAD